MDDYLVLVRRLGRVQQRLTHTVQLMSQRIERLEGEVVRLRGQCVLAKTAALWGMSGWMQQTGTRTAVLQQGGLRVLSSPAATASAASVPWIDANQLICQTACVGHAHHWLDKQGQCRRDGEPCERLQAEGVRHVPAA